MNCEEVFVILTRGPFPSGARSDAAVEAHLQVCPDCQRLAAALRPNDRGLQETIESEDTRALPGYWGNLLGSSSDLAISLTDTVGYPRAQRIGLATRQQLSRAKNLNIGQFAAAVALGIVLAAALRTLVTVHAPLPGGGDPGIGMLIQEPAGLEPSHRAPVLSVPANFNSDFCPGKIQIPLDPLPLAEKSPMPLGDSLAGRSRQCCTQCHHSHGTPISSAAMLSFQQRCIECHDQPR
jgi:hypothetical protein